MKMRAFIPLAVALGLSGCGGDAAEDILFDPQNPGNFESALTESDQTRIIEDMWQTLTAQSCWDASFVGDPTIAGTPSGISQLSFSGNFQYRFVGSFDIYSGTIRLLDVGTYEGYPAAILETWSGGIEGLVVVNDESFAHVLISPGGAPYTTTYRPVGSTCL